MIVIAMYFLQVSWRFSSLNQLVNILTYVIEGLEEALREIIGFIILDENRPGRSTDPVRTKTYAETVEGVGCEADTFIALQDSEGTFNIRQIRTQDKIILAFNALLYGNNN